MAPMETAQEALEHSQWKHPASPHPLFFFQHCNIRTGKIPIPGSQPTPELELNLHLGAGGPLGSYLYGVISI